ncbi:hypothetical protein [Halalkalicoccus jeotgali]|uniref:Glycosyltransferase RgtA/B/C/D-like domain-containing protein n=1 Tax=Halalkalicoccus jeotgali (strain DSM 18796 / CECT 7217 / JCM 14584 / KCTC 4019 / B3) TaxID=795797 RepID=D8J6R6_HALJB|nr:hypothetical protein [Halalkalicoccus jeotgali]ADJ13943.1 hypothetical protein HacjB3_02750 [Halalkalicoccus jeotgali B3]ELY34013.1 hypothetical protein C497_16567 [Halalkalicoccus jeotgali B3]
MDHEFFSDSSNRRFTLTATVIAVVAPVVGIGAIVLAYLFGLPGYAVIGSYLAVPLVLASIFYVLASYQPTRGHSREMNSTLLLCLFLVPMALAISWMAIAGSRNYFVYAVFAFAGLSIFLQITHVNGSDALVLSQVSVLSLTIIWSVSLLPYYYVGGTDIIPHAWWIKQLNRGVPLGNIYGSYQDLYGMYPLWHILGSVVADITGIELRPQRLIAVISGIIYASATPLLYSVAYRVSGDRRIALLTPLFAAFNPEFIYYGTYSISRSITGILLVVFFWTLVYYSYTHNNRSITLLGLTIVAIVTYHAASIPFIVLIVAMYAALWFIYASVDGFQRAFPVSTLVGAALFVAAYWIYSSPFVLQTLVGFLLSPPSASGGGGGAQDLVEPLVSLLNYASYAPLVFFAVLGTMVILSDDRSSIRLIIIALLGTTLLGLTVPGPTTLIPAAGALNFDRWGIYSVMFVSIAVAVGVVRLLDSTPAHITYGVLIGAVLFLSFFGAVSADIVATDQPLATTTTHTKYLTEQEVSSAETLTTYSDAPIPSDFVVSRYIEFSDSNGQHGRIHVTEDGQLADHPPGSILLIRAGELEDRPLKVMTTDQDFNPDAGHNSRYGAESDVWNGLDNRSKVYDSGENFGYYEGNSSDSEDATGSDTDLSDMAGL